jgi:hypothetical protein
MDMRTKREQQELLRRGHAILDDAKQFHTEITSGGLAKEIGVSPQNLATAKYLRPLRDAVRHNTDGPTTTIVAAPFRRDRGEDWRAMRRAFAIQGTKLRRLELDHQAYVERRESEGRALAQPEDHTAAPIQEIFVPHLPRIRRSPA